ncbi:MAG: hypothetical protein WCK89_16455, partial [bacterium]
YRVAPAEAQARDFEQIPPEEVANAMAAVIDNLFTCTEEVLYRETLKQLDLSTKVLTERVTNHFACARVALAQSGRVTAKGSAFSRAT